MVMGTLGWPTTCRPCLDDSAVVAKEEEEEEKEEEDEEEESKTCVVLGPLLLGALADKAQGAGA